VLFPRIPVWDPNRFLSRWMPVVKPFLSKFGALLWLVMVVSAIGALSYHWPELKNAASDSIDPKNWLYLWFTFVLIKFIHELGHAFTCRRFGGEVHEMGIMFLVLVPTPYVDASTAWAFPNKWARMLVGAGGMVVELFFASIMAFIWLATKDSHTLVSQIAYNAMLIASVTTIVFNANPLLRYDGYYMLSDFWEIPNLQQKSKDYTMGLIKRHIFRIKSQQPLPPGYQRAQLFVYSIASGAYRIFVGLAIIIMVAFKVPVLGALMAIGGVVTWIGVPVYKIAKYLAIEPELHRKRGPAIAFTLTVAAVLLIVVGLIKFPENVDATGIVEPADKFVLNVMTPGFVQTIKAKDGQYLKKGDIILVSDDPKLDMNIAQQQARVRSAQIARQEADVTDQAQREIEDQTIVALQGQLADFQRQKNDQTVVSPIDGYLVAPKLNDTLGKWLQRGEELATVAQMKDLEIDALLEQRDGELAIDQPGAIAEIRLTGDPGTTLYPISHLVIPEATFKATHPSLTQRGGSDIAPDPNDKTGLGLKESAFEVIATVSNPDSKYYPGQRAYLRLKLAHRSLLWQWTNKFLQLISQHQQNPLV
jgi:putative peptide zinc metalloprotease protein